MRIPLNKSTLGQEEIDAAKAVLDSGYFTMGRLVLDFERAVADYLGVKNAVMVNSGSSANLLALFAAANPMLPADGALPPRLKAGSEVIVPALTWSTTIWPVIQAGAKPVFVDSDPETLQMTPAAVEAAITPNTAGIFIVHVLGGAVDMTAMEALAKKHNLWLLEDTCESFGVDWKGRKVGTFGQIGTYSFYFSHHITTIEGGMAVTDDDGLADLMRAMRAHGWIRQMETKDAQAAQHSSIDPRFLFITTGFNLRPTEINAAIGLEQLKRIEGFNASRRKVAARLDAGLARWKQTGQLTLMRHHPNVTSAPFGYSVLCENRETRDALQAHLEAADIETRPVICGNLTRQPALAHFDYRVSGELSGADRVMDCGIYWGTHPVMSDDEIDFIINTVNDYFR